MQRFDVIVVGGGILGLSLGYHLAGASRRVAVLERDPRPGLSASGRNAGMLRHSAEAPFLIDWAIESRTTWPREIRERAFRSTGSIIVGGQPPASHKELFAERTVHAREGDRDVERPGYFTAEDGLIDPPLFMAMLHEAAVRNGVDVVVNCAARSLDVGANGDLELETAHARYRAPRIVLAPGSWSGAPTGPGALLASPPFNAFARELFVLESAPNLDPLMSAGFYWDEEHGWYVRAYGADTVLVSVCEKIPVADTATFRPNSETRSRLRDVLRTYGPPVLSDRTPLRTWHCFRTFTQDSLPIVGDDPDVRGLSWLAGFGGFGMTTGFAAAHALARHLDGHSAALPPAVSPGRFLGPLHHDAEMRTARAEALS